MRKNFFYKAGCVVAQLLIISMFFGVKAKAGNIHSIKHHKPVNYKLMIVKTSRICNTTGNLDATTNDGIAYPIVYTNLLAHQGNNFFLTDGVAAVFDNRFSASIDEYDAAKQWNFLENIAINRNNTLLAVEFRPVPVLRDTIFFRLYLKQQPYTLQFFTQNFSGMASMHTWLVDTYLNTKTEINLSDTTLYNFIPNPDTLSYRNRFILVFDKQFIATPVSVSKSINQNDPNVIGITNVWKKNSGIAIFPNPVSNGRPMLRFSDVDKGMYLVAIYNEKGQKLSSYMLSHNGGNAVYPLQTSAMLKSGIYAINITDQQLDKTTRLKLIVNQ